MNSNGQEEKPLEGWDAIAGHFGVTRQTVQDWEKFQQMPVHRSERQRLARVYAYPSEVDAWDARRVKKNLEVLPDNQVATEIATPQPAAHKINFGSSSVWLTASICLSALGIISFLLAGSTERKVLEPTPTFDVPFLRVMPSLSSDGNRIVYSARPQFGAPSLEIMDMQTRKVTPLMEGDQPAWSPDGTQIAFLILNDVTYKGKIYVTTPEGKGPAEVATTQANDFADCIAWTPDSKSLIVSDREQPEMPLALFEVNVATGAKKQLTHPPAGIRGDIECSVSPDGSHIAFSRYLSVSEADFQIMDTATGTTVQLTNDRRKTRGIAWSPDGKDVIFSSQRDGTYYCLYNLPANATIANTPANSTECKSPQGEMWPSVNRSGKTKLVFEKTVRDDNIWRIPLSTNPDPSFQPKAVPVVRSPGYDAWPQISPRGDKLLFISDRNGWREIWTSDGEGNHPQRITSRKAADVQQPRWSPDGEWIVFSSRIGAKWDIFMIRKDGGGLKRLHEPALGPQNPTWSSDGNWIYFTSSNPLLVGTADKRRLFKKRANGDGGAISVRDRGVLGIESPDGKTLYFQNDVDPRYMWRMPLEGGEAQVAFKEVEAGFWSMGNNCIMFLSSRWPYWKSGTPVRQFDFVSGKTGIAGRIWPVVSSYQQTISATKDGKYLYYAQTDSNVSNLYVADWK